jgi:Rod binding domain-containing protein
MTALSLATPQIDPTAGPAATSAAELARRGQIHDTAQKFEASFLTSMLQTMFKSVSTAPPFGGGPGEDMWKSFLAEAMAKNMARRGGIGVSASVEREMLKLQGLKDAAQSGEAAKATPQTAQTQAAQTQTAQTQAAKPLKVTAYAGTLQSAPARKDGLQ